MAQIVDSAIQTGRIDRRVSAELATANGQPVRALVVTTPSVRMDRTFDAQQASLAPDKSELAQIPGIRVNQLLPSLNTTAIEITSSEALAELAMLPDATIMADELLQRSDYESEEQVQAPVVRSFGYDGTGTYLGIIDSGVDYTDWDLGSCSAPGAPPPCRVAILAPDFSHNANGSLYDDGVLDDRFRHGTNVAATASAMAPGARIIGADVFGAGGAYASDIAAAIQYMINLKAAGYPIVAVNLSLGIRQTTCVDLLGVSALRNAGIVAVAAAGNSAYINNVFTPGLSNPACVPGVVSVGATFDFEFFDLFKPSCRAGSNSVFQPNVVWALCSCTRCFDRSWWRKHDGNITGSTPCRRSDRNPCVSCSPGKCCRPCCGRNRQLGSHSRPSNLVCLSTTFDA
jgi:hypothetical protein